MNQLSMKEIMEFFSPYWIRTLGPILLLKYIAHVGNLEGNDFLSERSINDNYFTEDEKSILRTLSEVTNNNEVWAILEDKGMSAEEKNVALSARFLGTGDVRG